jgi:integrase
MELRPGLKDVRRPAALMYAYIVLSLLCGLRTEEARALRWAHVDLDGDPAARPPVPPHVAVWRSVRTHGETKTERSRRTLGLPAAAVLALRTWSGLQAGERLAAGDDWQDTGLVFTTHLGAALDAGNVRKMFKRVCTEADIGDIWTRLRAHLASPGGAQAHRRGFLHRRRHPQAHTRSPLSPGWAGASRLGHRLSWHGRRHDRKGKHLLPQSAAKVQAR